MVDDALLTMQQPYPGDELFELDGFNPELRFNITFKVGTGDYTIRDHLMNTRVAVARSLLEKPKFDISRWYAARQIKALGLGMKNSHQGTMGYTVHLVTIKLLTDGIASHYPCTNPELDPGKRFRLFPLRPGQTKYTLDDRDLEILATIPKLSLEDPSFDLVDWYKKYLDDGDTFKRNYSHTHLQRYEFKSMPETKVTCEDVSIGLDWSDSNRKAAGNDHSRNQVPLATPEENETMVEWIDRVLYKFQPFPGDGVPIDPTYRSGNSRFQFELQNFDILEIYDQFQGYETHIHLDLLRWSSFSIGKWYAERCAENSNLAQPWKCAHEWMGQQNWEDTRMEWTMEIHSGTLMLGEE